MIGALSGSLAEIELTADVAVDVIVDVHGVGYRVTIGARHAASIGPLGTAVQLSVHTHVREGAITLYGFVSSEERRTFELLLSTHGVGPALALAILSVHTPAGIARAVQAGDIDALALVPGIGKKTAQRLILELATRLDLLGASDVMARTTTPAESEVREALGALGYAPDEIRVALEHLPTSGSVEELLREALSELAPRR